MVPVYIQERKKSLSQAVLQQPIYAFKKEATDSRSCRIAQGHTGGGRPALLTLESSGCWRVEGRSLARCLGRGSNSGLEPAPGEGVTAVTAVRLAGWFPVHKAAI